MIRKTTTYFIALAALLCSCDDFLERSAQNLVIPTTCSDYAEILQGEGYFDDLLQYGVWLNLMTDDMELYTPLWDNALPFNLNYYRYAYQWRDELEIPDEGFNDELFGYLYSQVLIANTCLDALPDLEGSDEEKDILRGQALFHRAYAYLLLANLYAVPYDKATPDTECVPLKTDPTPSLEPYYRATFGEVYALIEDDIKEGLAALKGKKTGNYYYIGYDAMLFVAMREALYTENFDAVIEYASEILNDNDKLFDITDRITAVAPGEETYSSKYDNFFQPANPELVFAYTGNRSLRDINSLIMTVNSMDQTFCVSHTIDNNLVDCYDYDTLTHVGDHRMPYWFIMPHKPSTHIYYLEGNYQPLKYNLYDNLYRHSAFRTAEAYITLAEAYARKASPDYGKALDYANRLRKYRLDSQAYVELTPSDFASSDAIVQFIWDERRRELCFEELHRWIDLRRTTRPEIIHPYGKTSGYYKLEKDDGAYTLNFPSDERLLNPQNTNARPLRQMLPYENN